MNNYDEFHIDNETTIALMTGSLSQKRKDKVQAHLENCSTCFREVSAYYKSLNEFVQISFAPTPQPLIEKALKLYEPIPKPATKKMEFRTWFKELIQPIPAWGYAVSFVSIAILLVFFLRPTPVIQNNLSETRLVIFENAPLGFVNEKQSTPFSGMSAQLSEDGQHIIFQWPAVESTEFYQVDLIDGEDIQRITPVSGIQESNYSYPAENIVIGKNYNWQITGKLTDGRDFQAKASFIKIR